MTSLNLKVLQVNYSSSFMMVYFIKCFSSKKKGGLASNERMNDTIRIPRSCLKQDRNEVNSFSMALPTNPQTCSIEWKPLDKCRKYTFDMTSQYTATWNGSSTSVDIFTKGSEGSKKTSFKIFAKFSLISIKTFFFFKKNLAILTIFSNVGLNPWRCPKKHFSCSYWNCHTSEANFVCDGGHNCDSGRDEQYCDQSVFNAIFFYIFPLIWCFYTICIPRCVKMDLNVGGSAYRKS